MTSSFTQLNSNPNQSYFCRRAGSGARRYLQREDGSQDAVSRRNRRINAKLSRRFPKSIFWQKPSPPRNPCLGQSCKQVLGFSCAFIDFWNWGPLSKTAAIRPPVVESSPGAECLGHGPSVPILLDRAPSPHDRAAPVCKQPSLDGRTEGK